MATTMIGRLDTANLNGGQKLAVKYFTVAMVLFGAQILFGMLAGLQYLKPDLFYGVLDFSVNRMVHVNAMVVWMLYGFIGATYWMLEEESQHEVVGLKLGNLIFWVLTAAVTVVVLVYLFVQIGPGEQSSIWLINEGREYIEAPRWADIGIVVSVLVFFLMWPQPSPKAVTPVSLVCWCLICWRCLVCILPVCFTPPIFLSTNSGGGG